MKKSMSVTISIGASAVILAALTGCSDKPAADGSPTTPSVAPSSAATTTVTASAGPATTATTATTTAVATTSPMAPTSPTGSDDASGAGAGAGSAKITLNGQNIPVSGPVRCGLEYTTFVIAAGRDWGKVYIKMDEDAQHANLVRITDTGGGQYEQDPSDAQVTKTGNSYTLTGQIPFKNYHISATPTPGPTVSKGTVVPFEVEVTCP